MVIEKIKYVDCPNCSGDSKKDVVSCEWCLDGKVPIVHPEELE